MTLTKKEAQWIKYGWSRLAITIGIYWVFGDVLSQWVLALDGLSAPAANIIVFGIVGMAVTTVVHILDNKRV